MTGDPSRRDSRAQGTEDEALLDDAHVNDAALLDDDAHLAALLAVLAVTRAGAAPQRTPLQQWRARRLAALAADHGASSAIRSALPRATGQRRAS
jgi:hypothetical protein